MLLEAKSLNGRCHGNGMTITVSLWLYDFYVIRNLLRQLFWHSEKVTYQLFYWACMILRENAGMYVHVWLVHFTQKNHFLWTVVWGIHHMRSSSY